MLSYEAMQLFDAHLHLFDPRVTPVRTAFESFAQVAGVVACIGCAEHPALWDVPIDSALSVVRAYGIHPWYADEGQVAVDDLRDRLAADPAAIVGEIGLDGLRPTSDNGAAQVALFRAQLALAADLNRPVVLHGARAWQALFRELMPWVSRLPAILLHGATFSPETLRLPLFQKGNFWISLGGAVVNPNARTVRSLAAALPAEQLLIETDAPDLLPFGAEGLGDARLNHPGNLPLIAETVAQLRGCDVATLAAQTFTNARKFAEKR